MPVFRITFPSLKLVLKKGFDYAPSVVKVYQILKSEFDPLRGPEPGLNFNKI